MLTFGFHRKSSYPGAVAPYMEPSAEEGLHLPQSLVAVDPCVDSLDPAWGPHIVTSSCEKATGGSSTPWGMGTLEGPSMVLPPPSNDVLED
ncbi:hypothetical protein BHE74_00014395 [Ensete ventricosum]|nr:hypothetical protein BHE74_00014395 [Ensete ventricosum]